jgi:hypothetical protein
MATKCYDDSCELAHCPYCGHHYSGERSLCQDCLMSVVNEATNAINTDATGPVPLDINYNQDNEILEVLCEQEWPVLSTSGTDAECFLLSYEPAKDRDFPLVADVLKSWEAIAYFSQCH